MDNPEYQDSDLDEVEIEAIGIEVSSQPIELYKIFKIANLVNGGGEAKHIISEGYVAVNGEIETRKRRKIFDGDLIEFNQEYYVVLCDLREGMEPEPPELFAEDLTDEEYLVDDSAAEHTWVEQQPTENEVEPELETEPEPKTALDESDSQQNDSAKPKGRKSIQFF